MGPGTRETHLLPRQARDGPGRGSLSALPELREWGRMRVAEEEAEGGRSAEREKGSGNGGQPESSEENARTKPEATTEIGKALPR